MSNATALEIAEEIARQRFELEVQDAGIAARNDALNEANYAHRQALEELSRAENAEHDARVAALAAEAACEAALDARADRVGQINALSRLLADATLGKPVTSDEIAAIVERGEGSEVEA